MYKSDLNVPAVSDSPDLDRPQFSHYALIEAKVNAAVERGDLRVLFTDIDSTLVIGAGHTPQEITKGLADARILITTLNTEGSIIIPVTGGHFESATMMTASVLRRIQTGVLPHTGEHWTDNLFRVDAYASDGGARAVIAEGAEPGRVDYDSLYHSHVGPSTIDYDALLNEGQSLGVTLDSAILQPLNWALIRDYDADAANSRFSLQPGTADGVHRHSNKVAFFFYANTLDERDLIEARFVSHFKPLGLKIICCEEKDVTAHARRIMPDEVSSGSFPMKYCLDIVPYNKATAAEYFADYINHLTTEAALRLGKARPEIEFWAAGDAGNDFPLLSSTPITHAVVVGGASEELIRLKSKLEERGKSVYVEASPGRLGPASIYHAMTNQSDR